VSTKKHVTPTRIRLAAAAKIMGCSRRTAYRRLRQFAVFSDGSKGRLEVDSARVFKIIANDRYGELPIIPELQGIGDELQGLKLVLERLFRGVHAIGKKVGVHV